MIVHARAASGHLPPAPYPAACRSQFPSPTPAQSLHVARPSLPPVHKNMVGLILSRLGRRQSLLAQSVKPLRSPLDGFSFPTHFPPHFEYAHARVESHEKLLMDIYDDDNATTRCS